MEEKALGSEIIEISMKVNGVAVILRTPANRTLLSVLREDLHLTGVKEGCGVGECGACTVLMNGKAVNACMVLAPKADGSEITTIEGLGNETHLHPLQKAFMKHGAVQCGFCTPGMILSAKALLDENPNPTRLEIREGISGNLCRCTGYQQIVDAIEDVANRKEGGRGMSCPTFRYAIPQSISEAVEILHLAKEKGMQAKVLAGGTDLMIQMRDGSVLPDVVVDISGISALKRIERMGNEIRIGSMVTHAGLVASELIREYVGVLSEAAKTVGSPQIRNLGTLGGNVVNASPAADTIPALVILESRLVLKGPERERTLSVTDFFTAPYKTVIEADELLTDIVVPLPPPSGRAVFLKLARRKAVAIARMNLACMLYYDRQKELFEWVRLCVGSSTPRPVRMTEAEKALIGKPFSPDVLQEAGRAAAEQMVQLSGQRSSTAYKKPVVGDLVMRAVKLAVEKG